MKNIFISFCTMSIILGQTIDINALRMAQTKMSSSGLSNGSVTSERQIQTKIKIDKPIDSEAYIVGPGDQFLVNIIASDNVSNYTLTVSPTGEILIPSIGIVQLKYLSLSNSIIKMKSAITALNQSAQVYIILSEIREFKIKVIGHLQNPGFYTVTPMTRVSDLFQEILSSIQSSDTDNKINRNKSYKSSINDVAYPQISKRNAFILRGQDTIFIDLSKFGTTGMDEHNPLLNQGDIVTFPLRQHFIGIYGGIKIPGNYEYVLNESLYDFIQLSGGLRPDADPTKIEVTRFANKTEKHTFNTTLELAKDINTQPEDHIMVRYSQNYKKQDVVIIIGEVHYPGVYTIEPGMTTVNDILIKAGGFTSKADSTKMIINNGNIALIPDKEKLRIMLIPEENRSIEERAYIKARMLTKKGSLESNSKDQTESIFNFKVSKNDEILIPKNYNYVEVLGAVERPGRYPFNINNNANKYLDLAGGVTSTATSKKYIIKAGTGQRLPFKKNIPIENGDAIFIAEKMEYNKWLLLKDILTTFGQFATLIAVIQATTGN